MKITVTLFLASAAVTVGLLAGARALLQAEPRPPPPQVFEVTPPTPAEPVFVGELLGIVFGPAEYLAQQGLQDGCPDAPQTRASGFAGGETSFLPAPKYLPAGAVMPPVKDDVVVTAPNPGTWTCQATNQLMAAWRRYELPKLASGSTPYISIHRELQRPHTSLPYRLSQLEVITIAGRPAIRVGVAEEIFPGEPAEMTVMVPEQGAMTLFHTRGVPLSEAMKIVESLVQALAEAETQ